jgi:hypothetical protein
MTPTEACKLIHEYAGVIARGKEIEPVVHALCQMVSLQLQAGQLAFSKLPAELSDDEVRRLVVEVAWPAWTEEIFRHPNDSPEAQTRAVVRALYAEFRKQVTQ